VYFKGFRQSKVALSDVCAGKNE